MTHRIYSRLYRYSIAFTAFWSVVIALSLYLNIANERRHTRELSKNEARISFNKDQAFRMWAAFHGGIYVPPDNMTPPNPYLKHIVDRDLLTNNGKKLTLMNPAYMLRQIMGFYADLYGTRGRITSLKVLNPINRPDKWETEALEAFERGEKEVFEFTDIDGEAYLRLMRPMITKQACLKCHFHQGYKVNDIRGGVSISVPMKAYLFLEREKIETLFITHVILWLIGLAAISVIVFREKKQIGKHSIKEEEVKRLTSIIEITDDIVGISDREGNILYLNNAALKVFGISAEGVDKGRNLSQMYPGKVSDLISKESFTAAIGSGIWKGETRLTDSEGKELPLSQVVLSHRGTDGGTEFFSTIARDITDRKKAEEEIRRRLSVEENLLVLSKIFSSQESPDFYKALFFLDEIFSITRACIFLFHKESKEIHRSYVIHGGVRTESFGDNDSNELPWFCERIESGENIVIYDTESIPDQGRIEKKLLMSNNITSFLAVPIEIDGNTYGFTAITGENNGLLWTKDHIRIIRIINEMIANYLSRQEAKKQITDSLHEKELLLKEIHHRVKNNLQLISSLIYLQSENVKEKNFTDIMRETGNRIQSMALIHEKLYLSENLANINFSDYVRDFTAVLFNSYSHVSRNVSLKLNLENCLPDIDRAIPCGLILNELVSNSLEHAFPDNKEGEIYIELKCSQGGTLTLTVKDNGIGLPGHIDPVNRDSLGLNLVFTLAERQLKGSVNVNRNRGTEFIIEF